MPSPVCWVHEAPSDSGPQPPHRHAPPVARGLAGPAGEGAGEMGGIGVAELQRDGGDRLPGILVEHPRHFLEARRQAGVGADDARSQDEDQQE